MSSEDCRDARQKKLNPKILMAEAAATGLPRSGTTKLQRMLSAAPEVQKLYLWRRLNPAPFPGASTDGQDPRMTAAVGGGGFGSEATQDNAQLKAAHEIALMQAEEEVFLFDFTLDPSVVGVCAPYLPPPRYRFWASERLHRQSLAHCHREAADIRNHVPADTPIVSAQERDEAIRLRRKGAQLRRRW